MQSILDSLHPGADIPSQKQIESNIPLPLPTSPLDLCRLHSQDINSPALNLIASSLRAHRSCNELIVFVYGLSGAGKSSTLNYLFGADIISTKDNTSATKEVTEYGTMMNCEDWNVCNLNVRYIDVPGWHDTSGTKQDAINFALIEHYIKIHPILGSHCMKFYPSIIIIVLNANDNRMLGPESDCAKMLQAISKLNMVDEKRPNVLFVLTHVCSFPKSTFTSRLSAIEKDCKKLANTHLNVDPSVVLIENAPKDYVLKEDGEWFILYNEVRQPLNLFIEMDTLMKRCGDEIGIQALAMFMANNDRYPIKKRLIRDKVLDISDLLIKTEGEWNDYIKLLSKINVSAEIAKFVKNFTKHNKCKYGRFSSFYPLLEKLQISGFVSIKDLKSSTLNQIKDRLKTNELKPYELNTNDENLLTSIIDLKESQVPEAIQIVGYGYNMSKDIISAAKIFDLFLDQTEFSYFFATQVPKCFNILPFEETNTTFGSLTYNSMATKEISVLKSEVEQFSQHLNELQLRLTGYISDVRNKDTLNSFCDFIRTGQLAKELEDDIEQTKKFNYRIEEAMYAIILDLTEIRLSPQFKIDVKELPNNCFFDKLDLIYESFFQRYGHYIIIKAIAGGIIEGTFDVKQNFENCKKMIGKILSALNIYFDCKKEGEEWDNLFDDSDDEFPLMDQLDSTPYIFRGGRLTHNVSKQLKELTLEEYRNWYDQVKETPIIFKHNLSVIPIYHFVELVDSYLAKEVEKYFKLKFPDTVLSMHQNINIDLKVIGQKIEQLANSEVKEKILTIPSIVPPPQVSFDGEQTSLAIRKRMNKKNPKQPGKVILAKTSRSMSESIVKSVEMQPQINVLHTLPVAQMNFDKSYDSLTSIPNHPSFPNDNKLMTQEVDTNTEIFKLNNRDSNSYQSTIPSTSSDSFSISSTFENNEVTNEEYFDTSINNSDSKFLQNTFLSKNSLDSDMVDTFDSSLSLSSCFKIYELENEEILDKSAKIGDVNISNSNSFKNIQSEKCNNTSTPYILYSIDHSTDTIKGDTEIKNNNNKYNNNNNYISTSSSGDKNGASKISGGSHSKSRNNNSSNIFPKNNSSSSELSYRIEKMNQAKSREQILHISRTLHSNDSECFPANATVMLKNGTKIHMSQLRYGDYVLSLDTRTCEPVYSKVYLWGHYLPDIVANFLEISHEHGSLRVTDKHLLLTGADMTTKMAGSLKIGDMIHLVSIGDGGHLVRPVEITSISTVIDKGYYSPLTMNSVIVVNGIAASVFAVPGNTTDANGMHKKGHQIFTPFRLAERFGAGAYFSHWLHPTTGSHRYSYLLQELYNVLAPFTKRCKANNK